MSRRRHRNKKISHVARDTQPSPAAWAFHPFLACAPRPLQDALVRAAQHPQTCVLCGHPATMLGVFCPSVPETWGLPAGWRAFRIYAVCDTCRERPDCQARVEADTWRHRGNWTAQVAALWN